MGRGGCGMTGSMRGPWGFMGMMDWDDWDDDDMGAMGAMGEMMMMTNSDRMQKALGWLLGSNRMGEKNKQCLISNLFRCISDAFWEAEPEGALCEAMGAELLEEWTTVVDTLVNGDGFPLPTDCERMAVLHKSFKNATKTTFNALRLRRYVVRSS